VNGAARGASCSGDGEVRIVLNDAADLVAGDVLEVTLTLA